MPGNLESIDEDDLNDEQKTQLRNVFNPKMDEKTKAAYANKHPGNPFKEKKKEEKKKEAPLDATAQ